MLHFHTCLPESWWEFSVNHVVYLYNRTPIKRLDWITPFEKIEGETPDVSNFKVYGCAAYVYLPPKVRKNKLSPKSELMIFLGFEDGYKGYLFMHLPKNSLFRGATAIFAESVFPKCDNSVLGSSLLPPSLIDNDEPVEDLTDSMDNHSFGDDHIAPPPADAPRGSRLAPPAPKLSRRLSGSEANDDDDQTPSGPSKEAKGEGKLLLPTRLLL